MDYLCSEKGRRLPFFGEQGEHCVSENGKPVFADTVAKHPNLAVHQ